MADSKPKILIVEDELSIRKFIAINLHRNHFDVLEAEDGETALLLAQSHTPAVVVLDVMLPRIDGFEVCMQIRRLLPQIIIIMLTARGEDMDKIMGLDLGADDYMVKPFNPLELVARIRAHLRKLPHTQLVPHDCIRFCCFRLDLTGQCFYKNDTAIDLTPTEFSIMKLFISNPNKAFSRNEILNTIWGPNYFGDIKTVDVHIRRIREKIEENPSSPCWIETVWGLGYRLKGSGSHA